MADTVKGGLYQSGKRYVDANGNEVKAPTKTTTKSDSATTKSDSKDSKTTTTKN